jgi:hypothetical protein
MFTLTSANQGNKKQVIATYGDNSCEISIKGEYLPKVLQDIRSVAHFEGLLKNAYARVL